MILLVTTKNTWPTIFTRPNITHFEEKDSGPDHLRKNQVNSRLFNKYSMFLSK